MASTSSSRVALEHGAPSPFVARRRAVRSSGKQLSTFDPVDIEPRHTVSTSGHKSTVSPVDGLAYDPTCHGLTYGLTYGLISVGIEVR